MLETLKPWFEVAKPHEDICKGRLSEAVFAANIWAVAQKTAPDIYLDPEAFFSKTYITGGLKNVMKRVGASLSGEAEAGDRIFSLQTSFGGGKTHTLVALWHIAKRADIIRKSADCAAVREVMGDSFPSKVKGVAVFTNQTCDATQGRQTPEGVRTRTLWGELALQLGGKELYKKIQPNDEARTAPQGIFVEILKQASPCLILLDEIADYCVVAAGEEVGTGTLADQTISFVQQLTEAAQQVPGVAIVATLPASALEVSSSEKGQDILVRLEKRFGRMGADIKPVADEEIYQVVRRRLFEELGDPAEHKRAAEAYVRLYDQHRNEVPAEASKAAYRERIIAAYPFHPTLIDALYLRWGSHGDFQRTRGVLRLLASVVGDLWKRRKNATQTQPLIQPCHVSWTIDAMSASLTRLWGAPYEAVIAQDVIGEKANASLLDEEKGGDYPTERITQGIASAILLGSFGGQGEKSGYTTKDLKLAVSRPGLNWSYTDGALLTFEERSFYLHPAAAGSLGKRYWFGTKPTLAKLIVQYRQQFAANDFDVEIVEGLQEQVTGISTAPATWRVFVNPEANLPEQKSLALLIMPPTCSYSENGKGPSLIASPAEKRLLEISQKCGSKERIYKNTLLFLLPSPRGLTRLRNAFREVAVLETIKRDYSSQLDEEQKSELKGKFDAAKKSVGESLCAAYTQMAKVEGQSVEVTTLPVTRPNLLEHLREAWKHIVEEEEWVLRKVGTVTLQKVGVLVTEGSMRVRDAIECFLRYTDKPMIASKDAVLTGLSQACREKLIGIGRGLDATKLQKKSCGEEVMLDPNEDGLWIIPAFTPESATPVTGTPPTTTPTTTTGKPGQSPTQTGPGSVPTGKTAKRITISGSVPAESWSDVFRCFVNPGVRLNPKKLKLGIDFELVFDDGQKVKLDEPSIKAMKEAARQLGLEMEVEE
ncbi:MAG: DUF499 domain-containing protein [Verrucomicrobia bacterium]|jgi:hypothetical protein|nr:DUF499 domain-containing protein [Verrucomicrobiota bacterium]